MCEDLECKIIAKWNLIANLLEKVVKLLHTNAKLDCTKKLLHVIYRLLRLHQRRLVCAAKSFINFGQESSRFEL